MNKIHFVSLFCVNYDLDILTQWSRHYRDFSFDSYKVYLHSPTDDKFLLSEAALAFMHEGFQIETVTDNPNHAAAALRLTVLDKYVQSIDKDDFIVVADSDELHDMDPESYREIILSHDYVKGELVDRYDHTAHAAIRGLDLDSQYPLSGHVIEKIASMTPGLPWNFTSKHKIMAHRAGVPVSLVGHHRISGSEDSYNCNPGNIVFHYTWRKSILERLSGKPYFGSVHLVKIAEFFGIKDTTEIEKKVDEETRKRLFL